MFFMAIVLLGFISWGRLPQELFPSITYPQITVVTSYENAAPEEMESLVTKIIEEAVGTVNNVKRITSISKEGLSLVMAEFNWGTNMDFAALNVREKIDLVKEKLPRESQEPIVMKYNPFDLPIMNLAVTGPMSPLELREICRKYIKDALEKVEGVAAATITGGDEREIMVQIDQPRLRASQISIISVVDSLKATNINYPAGTIKESFYEYLIRTMGEYQKVTEIKDTPTALETPGENAKTQKEKEKQEKEGRRLIYLRDIAKVIDTIKEKTSVSRYNAKDSVSIVIRKQSGSNATNVAKGVRKEIGRVLKEKLPPGVSIQITYDHSQFIQSAIANVRDSAWQGALLAFLVLLFILRDWRSATVITTSIPVAIMATLCLMYFSNINLNIMSLGGLALGVGMLVDNSVVVIENIFRYRQMGHDVKTSCIDGSNEMVAPVMGSTLTTVAVFLPFAFVVGVIGQIFKQLSFTISFSLMASIVTAISMVPVLISMGGSRASTATISPLLERVTRRALKLFGERDWPRTYENFIRLMVQKRLHVIAVIVGLFLLAMLILSNTERQFMPRVDQRQFIVKVDLSPGTRLEITDRVVKTIEQILLSIKETKDVTVNIGSSEEKTASSETAIQALGSHQSQIMVNLHPKSKKLGITRSTDDVINYLKTALEKRDLEGAGIEYVAQETSFGSALEQGAPVAIEIKGPNLTMLQELAAAVQNRLNKIPGVYGVKSNMPLPSPETKLNILKDRASLYGLSVRDIAVTAQVALKGYVATKFKEKSVQEDVDIRVRLRSEDRSDLGNLRRLLIHSPLGMDIPMSEVAYFSKGAGPTEIKRIDQQRSILLTANIYKRSFNLIARDTNEMLTELRKTVSKDYTFDLAGENQRMKESFTSLAFALVLAFILVYMIMAAEFESLWQPFIIMFTIPLSLIGVASALFISRTPLSSVAYLGIIMLGGIAVNNGIVLIEFVNDLTRKGTPVQEALIQASIVRLRPILLTSLTTVFGLVPLAMGIGEGAELQAPLAITVMGGLTSATFLTLVFIPCLFLVGVEVFKLKPAAKLETEPGLEELRPELDIREHLKQKPAGLELSAAPEIQTVQAPMPESIAPEPITAAETPLEKPQEMIPPELNSRQTELLEKLKAIKRITRKEYADMFNISIPTAARDLRELVDKKVLKPQGPLGPGRWYELA
jgi:HAE1 family hydrophobic/amphiphilic exporter-1